MAITHTGTVITVVENTGTTIDSVAHTGTTVFSSAPKTKQWVFVYSEESQPTVDLGILESSNETSLWLWELGAEYPAPDYPVGTSVCVWDGGNTYFVYQIQEV